MKRQSIPWKTITLTVLLGTAFTGCNPSTTNYTSQPQQSLEPDIQQECRTKGSNDENEDGLPAPIEGRKEIIIKHNGFIISYNPEWKIPNWVAWRLSENELQGDADRSELEFTEDPQIQVEQAETFDYSHSGYSRGHMAPAADFKWSQEAMSETYCLTNICPQDKSMNKYDWGDLEKQCRFWARKNHGLWIVTGPIVGNQPRYIGKKHKVAVPEGFFKVIYADQAQEPKMLGFIYNNRNEGRPMQSFVKTIDEVEEITGIDFFPRLPDKIENRLEAENSMKRWRWRASMEIQN